MTRPLLQLTLATMLFFAVGGCSIHHDTENGKKDDVDIKTPFGSLSVREGHSDVKETGLSLYPGARAQKDIDDSHHSANVNISSSLFGLKVVALKYESDDSPEKILGFYRKEMGKYGNVIDCTGGFNMNFHHHDNDAEVSCNGHGSAGHEYKEELKVGTENNQRVLAVRPSGKGSAFALVYVRAWEHNDTQ